MEILRINTEICLQPHQMFAEGTSDIKPTKEDIEYFLKSEKLNAFNIEIFYDGMQCFWRWRCDIKSDNNSTIEQIKQEIASIELEISKFWNNDNHSAGLRAKKGLSKIKKLSEIEIKRISNGKRQISKR